MLGKLDADPAPDSDVESPASPANSPVTVNPPAADNTQTPDSSLSPQSGNGSQAPTNPPILATPNGFNSPFLPQQSLNANSPNYISTNPQSPVLTAPSLYVTGANSISQIGTNAALSAAFESNAGAGGGLAPEDGDESPLGRIRLGPVDLNTALATTVVNDDNLRGGDGAGGRKSDTSYNVTPAVLFQYGNHDGQTGSASIIYAPTITRYFHESNENTDDQNVAFNAQYPFQRLTLDIGQSYTQTTGINSDTNTLATQSSSYSTIGASYIVDDKITVSSNIQETMTTFDSNGGAGNGGAGDKTTSLNNSAIYRLSDKLTLGPSFNVGYDDPDISPKSFFEQALAGATYAATDKIHLFVQAGAEFDQYDHAENESNPIFSLGLGYNPFDSTDISLNASQSSHSSSGSANQNIVNTSIGVSATQRFLHRYYLGFDFGYTHSDYQAISGAPGGGGNGASQDSFSYRPSVNFSPTGWTHLAVYYQYFDNQAGAGGQSYNDNQVGVSFSAQF